MRPRCRLRNNATAPGSWQYGTCEQYGGRNERDDQENRPNHHGSDQHRRRNRDGYETATSPTVGDEHTVPISLPLITSVTLDGHVCTLLPARARLLFSIAQRSSSCFGSVVTRSTVVPAARREDG